MKYSRAVKMSVLKKILPPNNESIRSVSKEMGMNEQTIRNWKVQSKSGKLGLVTDEKSLRYYSSGEKYQLLFRLSETVSNEALGKFLRERGLHSEHLSLWKQELREMIKQKSSQQDKERKADKKQIRDLQRELARKEKALAEAAEKNY